jgi:hypothetical protein
VTDPIPGELGVLIGAVVETVEMFAKIENSRDFLLGLDSHGYVMTIISDAQKVWVRTDAVVLTISVVVMKLEGVQVFSGAHQQNFAGVCLLLVHLKIKMHQQTTLTLFFFSSLLSLHSSATT